MEKFKKLNGKKLEEMVFNEIVNNPTSISEINKTITHEIKVVAKNDSQIKLINSIKNNEITICSGLAGSGKTYVALAQALSLLKKNGNEYKKIYLIKSVTPLKGESVGYIKGSLEDKLIPYMWSFNINILKIISENTLKSLNDKKFIETYPLTYLRGVSLDNCIIILDEAQNVTIDNAQTVMTRIGENCKLIILGDIDQIDLTNKRDSSLHILINIFDDVENIGIIKMSADDVNIRNPIITIIQKKFKEFYKTKNNDKKLV